MFTIKVPMSKLLYKKKKKMRLYKVTARLIITYAYENIGNTRKKVSKEGM